MLVTLDTCFATCDAVYRNYLEHVAGLIVEWTQQEEAKYQAALLAAEVGAVDRAKTASPDKKKARSPKPATRYRTCNMLSV